jgi:molybdopterin molybdotransferase
MISVPEAKQLLAKHLERGPVETVPLAHALGCVASADIHSPLDVPGFDNSAMDGYAMKYDGTRNTWKVVGVVKAGAAFDPQVAEGQAVRIFTGAKIPTQTDTVIPQEFITQLEGDKITLQGSIRQGDNVRLRGSQNRVGDKVLAAGTVLRPGTLGLLASLGVDKVQVYAKPRVAVVVTGDELRELGESLHEGEIYNSNGPMLRAFLRELGLGEPLIFRAPDTLEGLQSAVDKAFSSADVVLLSGGISVGDYDYVKEVLEATGVEALFYKLRQRPGKPLYAGLRGSQWVFALPGNPASVLACFRQYVQPTLRYWMGHNNVWAPDRLLPLEEDFSKKPPLTFFLKALHNGQSVRLLAGQESFNLLAFGEANCLVEVPEEIETLVKGSLVRIFDL